MFSGKVTILKTGFTKRKRIDKTIPPTRYPVKPPLTLTPSKTWVVMKRATE